ncbi:MAG: hypothetical protein HDS98_04310 [Bacteroidales bacterium]|nr:hypothetical protein [Bacteroidales bacterium]
MTKPHIALLTIPVAMLLAVSCNHHNEPQPIVKLPIAEEFLPVTVTIDRSDKELYEKWKEWNRNFIRVDSPAELPDDPLGFQDFYRSITYTDHTLLLFYQTHFWNIESLNYDFTRNTVERSYNWTIHMGTTDNVFEGDETPDFINFTRFAILVRKLPEDAKIEVGYGIGSFDTDWWGD